MRTYDLILKKRNGGSLSKDEIAFLIDGYVRGDIPDYQMAALCMAIYFQGMTPTETADLTLAMAHSGDMLDLSFIDGRKIDKHSTGGVGDTTTLVVAPLVASVQVPVAKMSGRGLGHTGGTIDKLESIPGFRADISKEDFIRQVNSIKVSVVGQTGKLAPADKLIYALRDVTATVESIPLIASSIMSKKIAAGADGFVLDVKTGKGAFMKTLDDAIELAKSMVSIGSMVGKDTVALVTDMNQPLGNAIGNALEVKEAILTLRGDKQSDLEELCLTIGAEMVVLAGIEPHIAKARLLLEKNLNNKKGLAKLREMIAAQGGDPRVVDDPSLLPQAPVRLDVLSPNCGYVSEIDSLKLGLTAMSLGAGRETKESQIDLSVGIELMRRVGDEVTQTTPVAVVHAQTHQAASTAAKRIQEAFKVSADKVRPHRLIYKRITKSDV